MEHGKDILDGFLRPVLTDVATLASIIGLILTLFLLWRTKDIRDRLINKLRTPDITPLLFEATSGLSEDINNWPQNKAAVIERLTTARGLLENLSKKLPPEERKSTKNLLAKLSSKRLFSRKIKISELKKSELWELYSDLNTLVTRLQELDKDKRFY